MFIAASAPSLNPIRMWSFFWIFPPNFSWKAATAASTACFADGQLLFHPRPPPPRFSGPDGHSSQPISAVTFAHLRQSLSGFPLRPWSHTSTGFFPPPLAFGGM
jgi:hypothetical protein